MAKWIPWTEVRAKLMQNPEIAENYDSELNEFKRQIAIELAAERAEDCPYDRSRDNSYSHGVRV